MSLPDSGINMEKKFIVNGQEVSIEDFVQKGEEVSFVLHGQKFVFQLVDKNGSELVLGHEGNFKAAVGSPNRDGESMVMALGREAVVSVAGKKQRKAQVAQGSLTSPMPGKIFKVVKEVGNEVKKGEVILILEAMKMEHSIRSDKDGRVKSIFYKPGEMVQGGVALAEVE
jgi:biotin carboxyl carrier protein